MVLRGMLERYLGYCSHGVTWSVKTPCRRDVTSVVLINFIIYIYIILIILLKMTNRYDRKRFGAEPKAISLFNGL